MWKCKTCGEDVENQFDQCWNCSALREGTPSAETSDFEADADNGDVAEWIPVATEPVARSAKGQSASRTSLAIRAQQRYKDAYLVAKTITVLGALLKGFGILAGVGILIASAQFATRVGGGDAGLLAGVVAGVLIGGIFFVMGVLVSAQGQVLGATLDSAVHSSPFLSASQKAQAMSI